MTHEDMSYTPTVIKYDEGGYFEFIVRDAPSVVRAKGGYGEVLDMRTRELIGVRWPIACAGFAEALEAAAKVADEQKNPSSPTLYLAGRHFAAVKIAAAIRALKEPTS